MSAPVLSRNASLPTALVLLLYLGGVIVGASLLAAIVFPLLDVVYDKVFSRALILMSVLGLYPLARALELNRDDLGLRGFESRFVAWGWIAGMILMLPPIALMFWVGFRHVDPRLEPEYLDYAVTFARFFV